MVTEYKARLIIDATLVATLMGISGFILWKFSSVIPINTGLLVLGVVVALSALVALIFLFIHLANFVKAKKAIQAANATQSV
jgi:hypothetical protein